MSRVCKVQLTLASSRWITARRRRSRGQTPFPLTGWVPGPPPYSVTDKNALPKYAAGADDQAGATPAIELARLPAAHRDAV